MLLPFALYLVRNSPYQLGLTSSEMMCGIPVPTVPSLRSAAIVELEGDDLIFRVRATQWAPEHGWPKLCALYEAGLILDLHKFQPGDWVYVRRSRQDGLEPRWRGPDITLLARPTASKWMESLSRCTVLTPDLLMRSLLQRTA